MMDLDNLRSLGVDYTILDKEAAANYHLYQGICYREGEKRRTSKGERNSDEKRLMKLEINRIRMAERRSKETEEERALRLYKNKMRNKIRRATETPEQRADRNRRNMERNRLRRIKQREQHTESENISMAVNEKGSSYYIHDLVRVELASSPIMKNDVPAEYENRATASLECWCSRQQPAPSTPFGRPW